jgi:hypothetical protein
MKYGFVIPLCRECHHQTHLNPQISDFLHKEGQLYWQTNLGSKNDFILVFRKNYLD